MGLHRLVPALCVLAGPAVAQEAEAFACTVTATCEGVAACSFDTRPIHLVIGQDGARVSADTGQEMGFDRPVTRRTGGPVTAHAAVTPLDTTMLLTFDRTNPEGADSRLMITEHARDENGARVVSLIATCRPERG